MRNHLLYLFAFLVTLALVARLPGQATESSGNDDPEVRGKKLSEWIREVHDADPGVRWAAMRILCDYGAAARKGAHALMTELGDRDPSLRANAAVSLGCVGLDKEHVHSGVLALARALSDSQQVVRYRAAEALVSLGPSAKEAIPALATCLKDYNASWEVRRAVVAALGTTAFNREEGPSPRALAALREALKDPCALVRGEAVRALVLLGRPAAAIELERTDHVLKTAIHDKDPVVALWAQVGVMGLEGLKEEHVKAIAKALRFPDVETRVQACRALATLGAQAADYCVQDLADALSDRDPDVAISAANALRLMGMRALAATPDLERLAKSKNQALKQAAEQALEAINASPDKAKQAAPAK